jgi:outer membrane protein OmpA-like peptidoglycan-associated protein
MKRLISILAPSTLMLGMLSSCASTPPPAELVDARAAYARAQSGPVAQNNRAGLMDAKQALDAAETKFSDSPGSDDVKTLSYVAQRKVEIAEADCRAAMAKSQQQVAEQRYLQLQAAQAKTQAAVSERRAKVALDQLGLAAKDEARGTVITLPEANMFATNKTEILPSARERLTKIADAVKQVRDEKAPEDRGRKILLIGYTDNTGSDAHNMDLSKRRAEAVKAFFAQHGLDPANMDAEGRGKADPVADNKTKDGRAENRRVEIVITPGPHMMTTPPPSGEEKGKTAPEGKGKTAPDSMTPPSKGMEPKP